MPCARVKRVTPRGSATARGRKVLREAVKRVQSAFEARWEVLHEVHVVDQNVAGFQVFPLPIVRPERRVLFAGQKTRPPPQKEETALRRL